MATLQTGLLVATGALLFNKSRVALRETFAKNSEQVACALGMSLNETATLDSKHLAKTLDGVVTKFKLSFMTLTDTVSGESILGGDAELVKRFSEGASANTMAEAGVYVTYCEAESNARYEIAVGHSYDEVKIAEAAILWSIAPVLAVQLGLLLLVAGIMAYFISKRTRPIAEACEHFSRGDLSLRIPVSGHDELSSIAESINQMVSKLEQHLQTQSAQSKLAALGEMAGGVAHEINNPLAVVELRAEMLSDLADDAPEPLATQIRNEAKEISGVVARMARIVKGMRNFCRDGSEDAVTRVPLKSVLEDAYGLCQEKFRSNGVNFEMQCPEDIMVEVRTVQISQLALNLFTNSYYAVKDSPSPWIRVTVQVEGDFIVTKFVDSGLGIPKDVAAKIMQPFYTTKPVGDGTGLGLSIALGFAKHHGGDLSLKTDEPNTTFVLRLPVPQQQVVAEAA